MKQTFGEFIREKRLEKALKLNVFAKLVGISPVYASYIENGKRPAPTKDKLDAFAKLLDLTAEEAELMYRLANRSHNKSVIPNDLADYVCERPYISDTIRTAKENDTPASEWLDFNDKIRNL